VLLVRRTHPRLSFSELPIAARERQGLVRTVTLGDVRERMADFSDYMRVDFTQGEWKYMGRGRS
jgi:hypothetical protein